MCGHVPLPQHTKREVQWRRKHKNGLCWRARGCTHRERGQLQSHISPLEAPSSRRDDLDPSSSSSFQGCKGLFGMRKHAFKDTFHSHFPFGFCGRIEVKEKSKESSWRDPVRIVNSLRSAFLLFGWWCGGTQGGPLTPIPSGAWTPTARVSMRATQI